MIIQVIGSYCIISSILGLIALLGSLIKPDKVADGARIKVQFLIVAELAVAAWCFK